MNSRKLFAGVASMMMAASMFGCSSNAPADDSKDNADNSGAATEEQTPVFRT